MTDKITFREYQDACLNTWVSSDDPLRDELRINLGLMGELGEIAEPEKKFHRGDPNWQDGQKLRDTVSKEIGGLLYYVAMKANMYDLDLDDILAENVEILADRKERGVIMGDGNER